MQTCSLTAAMIEELVAAKCGESASLREKHVFREALIGLVRLAKVEFASERGMSVFDAAPVRQVLAA